MNETWSLKWKKVLIWFSGYISFLAFAIIGGYTIVKSENEELKKTAKQTFLTVLLFAAISAVLSLFNYIGGFTDNYYSSSAYEIYSILTKLVSIAQMIVYTVFIVLSLKAKETPSNNEDLDKKN